MKIYSIFIVLSVVSTVKNNELIDVQFCEVCIKTIKSFVKTLSEEDKVNPEKIEQSLKRFCGQVKIDSKEDRLCYYIGASSHSATYAIGELSKPLSWGLPVEKICRERLAKSDPQICDLKYERLIDIDAIDLNKLKIKDLKKILMDWGEAANFAEKSEFIQRIQQVKNKYIEKKQDDLKTDF